MTQYNYVYQGYEPSKMARAVSLHVGISPKQAKEICSFIKHKKLDDAKKILNNVLAMKQAIPYKRYNKDIPHRPGMMAGRYPQNASAAILKLLESVEMNAKQKNINNIFITHISAHRAPPGRRAGRVAGEAKRAHIEVVVEEKKIEKKHYTPRKKTK